MQVNCISCASDVSPGRRNKRTRPPHKSPHSTQFTLPCRAIAQRRRNASRFIPSHIKQNKTRSLIKRSYLSKTNLPKSNKRKEKHNKINQNQITFKMGAQRCPELQAVRFCEAAGRTRTRAARAGSRTRQRSPQPVPWRLQAKWRRLSPRQPDPPLQCP